MALMISNKVLRYGFQIRYLKKWDSVVQIFEDSLLVLNMIEISC